MSDAADNWPKNYDFTPVERHWYPVWEQRGYFRAESKSDKPAFCIVIPPPNVTGSLHMGHALNNTLQDMLSRYKRMRGFNVLWMPGMDHAGIATQNVVERQLRAEGKSRHDLGREAFVERVWKWKEESGGIILNQLRRLGASCDWSRERFTMDPMLSRAVKEVFVRLHDDGLIYRARKLINWCPRCNTALSDLEVNHKEVQGAFYHIRYRFAHDPARHLTIATTRPETLLGDSAVAVHPEDGRYTALPANTRLVLPLLGREIALIRDDYVDKEFGTGALKITPGHDFNDFMVGKKHQLEEINILTAEGKINEAGGPYAGMDRFAARKKVVEDLEAQGLLEKIEPHKHQVGHCQRCDTVVEPWLSMQWFVKAAPLAEPALAAAKEKAQKHPDGRHTRFVPEHWEKTYFNWMENIQDWCISRQLWWGHSIPAWHCEKCGHVTVAKETPSSCGECGGTALTPDPDVLDTWFSSALWPFAGLGWPDDTDDLKTFYPTSVLITAFDIIFFWVARMMMMGVKFMDGRVPFHDVYIHALVRDAEGQKMSKSKGNVIDPLSVIDKFGADAFRFALAAFAAQGRDIKLSEDRIEGYKRFTQKIWNAFRFAGLNLEGYAPIRLQPKSAAEFSGASPVDHWILQKLDTCVESTTQAIEEYRFNEAASAVYQFLWHELCDWYIELIKPVLSGSDAKARGATQEVLIFVMDRTLRLLHPFMPFLTEELYQRLPAHGESIMQAEWPASGEAKFEAEAAAIDQLIQIVEAIRNIRGENGLKPSVKINAHVSANEAVVAGSLEGFRSMLMPLAGLEMLTFGPAPADLKAHVEAPAGACRVYLKRGELVNVEEERKRLEKEKARLAKDIEFVEKKLANEQFVQNAPPDILDKEKAKLAELKERQQVILSNLANLE